MTVVRNLRQHFRFPEKGLKHYFPMHMAKGWIVISVYIVVLLYER